VRVVLNLNLVQIRESMTALQSTNQKELIFCFVPIRHLEASVVEH